MNGTEMSGLDNVGKTFIELETNLANRLMEIPYPHDIDTIYNPLDYAIKPHTYFVEKYANEAPKDILFLGMNPGPWGMGQTG